MVLIFFIVLYLDMSFFSVPRTASDKVEVVYAFAAVRGGIRYSRIGTAWRVLLPRVVERGGVLPLLAAGF